MGDACWITLYIHARAVYVGVISTFMKVVRLILAEELEKQRALFGKNGVQLALWHKILCALSDYYYRVLEKFPKGSDSDKTFASWGRNSYVRALGHLKVLYGDVWAYLC